MSRQTKNILRFLWPLFLFVPANSTTTAQETNTSNLTMESFTFEADKGQQIIAEKGSLLVPENRSDPNSRLIPINFIKFKSTAKKPASPIVYLAGGPGGSGISITKRGFELFEGLTTVADVIVFDQRGTGEGAIRCPEAIPLPIDRVVKYEEVLRIVSEQSLACKKHWQEKGYDLSGYTTVESAHDVDDLRRALGIKKINLLGASYGSHYALAIMKLHETSVDRAVIAGIEGLDNTLKLPSYYENHFDDINAFIQKDPDLSVKIPDIKKMLQHILQRLDNKPEIVTIFDKKSGKNIDIHLGKFDVQLQVWGGTGRNNASASIPAMIYKMSQGDFETIAQRAYRFKTRALRLSAMTIMMDGASGASKARTKQIASEVEGSLFGNVVNFLFPEVGTAWNAPDLGDAYRSALQSDLPILIISGTMDPRTPVVNGDELAKGLPNSQHLIVTGIGHPPSFMSLKDEIHTFFGGEQLSTLIVEGRKVEFDPIE